MNRKTVVATGTAMALAVAFNVQAIEMEDFYVSLAGGVQMTDDHDFDTGGAGVGVVDTELDSGYGFKGAIGVQFDAWRIEFEVSQRSSDVDKHLVGGSALPGSDGQLDVISFMLNGVYDFHDAFGEGVTPYLGAGIGYVGASLDGYSVAGVPEVVDDMDASVSFQAIAGVSYSATERTGVFVEYNYLNTPGIELDTTLGENETETDFSMHAVFAGVRYSL